jgi:hypothetical protein
MQFLLTRQFLFSSPARAILIGRAIAMRNVGCRELAVSNLDRIAWTSSYYRQLRCREPLPWAG